MRGLLPLLMAAILLWPPLAPTADAPGRSPLVIERDGKLELARFQRCQLDGRELQFLVHAWADAAKVDRARLVAESARAATVEISRLHAADSSGTLECREIDAPVGDVDYEIEIEVSAGSVEVASVDVNERSAVVQTSYQARRRRAQGAEAPPGPCASTTMGRVFCAHAPDGVAVTTTMGEVVCARGQCVREASGTWNCSRASGGWAELTVTGPECEQGCYQPTQRQCRAA
jgi:hypothetical protein